ncbi:MAG: nucleotidyltransferase family protein [Candidatus Aminicenantes bacterium]|nr:nucleotidyltransferase family protein [Candidatus Aminicenantes bacterium]
MWLTRPETALLLRCASARLSPEEGARLADSLREGLDWSLLFRLAVRHRVAPLVFQNLARWAASRVPQDFLDSMRALHLKNLAGNVRAARALAEIMAAFEGAGIRAAAYKGPVLAEAAYGDLGLRMFNDLDVFVDRSGLSRALELAVERNYRTEEGTTGVLTPLAIRFLRDVVLRDPRRGIALEIQWRLAQRYHPVFSEPGELWDRTVRLDVEGASLRTFSAEDTLLLLCLHGLYHSWSLLQMVADVTESLRRTKIAADLVLGLAERHRAGRILFFGLLLARRLLAAPVPPALLEAARRDRSAVSQAADTARRFFEDETPAVRARRFFFREAMMFPGLGTRARYFAGRLLTPNEEDLAGRPLTWGRMVLLPAGRLLRLFRSYVLQDARGEKKRRLLLNARLRGGKKVAAESKSG